MIKLIFYHAKIIGEGITYLIGTEMSENTTQEEKKIVCRTYEEVAYPDDPDIIDTGIWIWEGELELDQSSAFTKGNWRRPSQEEAINICLCDNSISSPDYDENAPIKIAFFSTTDMEGDPYCPIVYYKGSKESIFILENQMLDWGHEFADVINMIDDRPISDEGLWIWSGTFDIPIGDKKELQRFLNGDRSLISAQQRGAIRTPSAKELIDIVGMTLSTPTSPPTEGPQTEKRVQIKSSDFFNSFINDINDG